MNRRNHVRTAWVGFLLVTVSLGLSDCGRSVTDIRGSHISSGGTGSRGSATLGDLLASDGASGSALVAQSANECERLAIEADRAARVYEMAVRDLARWARKAPDADGTAAARQVAIDAFNALQLVHQTMTVACRPVVVDGTYDLNPDLVLSCSFIPLGFGEVAVRWASLTVTSPTTILVSVPLELGVLPAGTVEFAVPYDAQTRTFGGTGTIAVSNPNVTASGTLTLNATFTGPDTFEGSMTMNLHLTVSYLAFSFSGQCTDLNSSFTGARQ